MVSVLPVALSKVRLMAAAPSISTWNAPAAVLYAEAAAPLTSVQPSLRVEAILRVMVSSEKSAAVQVSAA